MRTMVFVPLLVVLALVPVSLADEDDVPPADREKIRAAAPLRPPAAPAKARKLLVYTACKGYVHSAIGHGTLALRILGEKSGAFTITAADDPAVFKPENLRNFDGICFNNTTGELFDDPVLKRALLDFVRGGGGIVGIHAATDCFGQWPEFGALMGGYFDGHPWNEQVRVRVDEPGHPVVAMLSEPFDIADEIYQFKEPFSRDRLRILLSLDPGGTDMKKPGMKRAADDFAVSWVRNYGQGRVFYCSLGHREEVFWNPLVLAHYLAGIQFALGDLRANALPSSRAEPDGWERLVGTDLTGWICKPESWAVEDGALVRRGAGDIWTEQEFGDFVLELEFKFSAGANSGIFFRTANLADAVQTGIEMQVLDTHGQPPDRHACGAIYDCVAPAKQAVRPAGEWNQVTLTCRGPQITVVLNGEPIVDMNLDRWTEPGKNPDGSANKFRTAYKDMPRRGRIGFQEHGGEVVYRKIRIKPL